VAQTKNVRTTTTIQAMVQTHLTLLVQEAFRFLESIALNVSAKENSVLRKCSVSPEKQRLIERRKKVKAAMKDKYMQLSLLTQIDNLDIEISRLMSLRENESDD